MLTVTDVKSPPGDSGGLEILISTLFVKSARCSGHEVDRAGLLDRVVDAAVKLGGNTGHAARKDLSCLGSELAEDFRIGGCQLLDRDILPTAGHLAVRLAEIDAALDGLWLGHKISGVRGEGCGA